MSIPTITRRDPYSTPSLTPYDYTNIQMERMREELQSQISLIYSSTQVLHQRIHELETAFATTGSNWTILSKTCADHEAKIKNLGQKTKDRISHQENNLSQVSRECSRLSKEIIQLKELFHEETSHLKIEIENTKQHTQTSLTHIHAALAQNKTDIDRQIGSILQRIDAQVRCLKDEIKTNKQLSQTSLTKIEADLEQNKSDIDRQIASIVHRLDLLLEDREKQKEAKIEKPPLELTEIEKPTKPLLVKTKKTPQPPTAAKGKEKQTVNAMSDSAFEETLKEHEAKVPALELNKTPSKQPTRSPRRSIAGGNNSNKREFRVRTEGAFLSNAIANHYKSLLSDEMCDIFPNEAIEAMQAAIETAESIGKTSTKQ